MVRDRFLSKYWKCCAPFARFTRSTCEGVWGYAVSFLMIEKQLLPFGWRRTDLSCVECHLLAIQSEPKHKIGQK